LCPSKLSGLHGTAGQNQWIARIIALANAAYRIGARLNSKGKSILSITPRSTLSKTAGLLASLTIRFEI
jgi:hypothetical protein